MNNYQPDTLLSKKIQSGFNWNGNTIIIESRLSKKYLFIATESIVYLNGEPVINPGGLNLRDRGSFEFKDTEGKMHTLEFDGGGVTSFTWVPFTIRIDGEIVYKGASKLKNPWLPYIGLFAIMYWLVKLLENLM